MDDIMELVPALIEAAQGGKWAMLSALIIMIIVWLATKAPVIKDWIKGEARVWVAAIAGMLSAFATQVIIGATEGSVDWIAAIVEALAFALLAGGLGTLISRKISGKAIDADGDGILDPEEPAEEPTEEA